MRALITCLTLLLVCPMTFAQWGKKVKGNGNVVTVKRSTEQYNKISSAGSFDIELVSGKEGKITLQGEENILDHIETFVKDGVLKIKTEKGYSLRPTWGKKIKITVPFQDIEGVSLAGSGNITSKATIKAEKFRTSISGSGDISLKLDAKAVKVAVSGSGDVVLKGNTDSLEVAVSGSGEIEAKQLSAKDVEVSVAGSGDASIQCNRSLKARVSGSGDVVYKGNPEKVDSKVAGSGEVSKI